MREVVRVGGCGACMVAPGLSLIPLDRVTVAARPPTFLLFPSLVTLYIPKTHIIIIIKED